ncbi:glucose-6-phosphate dehydrogenase [Candidatus Curtissbacteria bacterium]|nr:glucose-6-phosphate dehydrogenase [Candidatus Curtissbacteria bacterium]
MPAGFDIKQIKNLPTVFVIFGATGDLSRKKLFPALFALFSSQLLPEKFKIIAAARTPHTREDFAQIIETTSAPKDKKIWQSFIKLIEYLSLDIAEDENLPALSKMLDDLEIQTKVCVKRIFYMAISPHIYQDALENLGKNKLHLGCQTHGEKPRIVVEKPFGQDLTTARSLNDQLQEYFDEDQIYRIDHYLGKETVQNIFAFRFGNELFEPIWNNHFIDHIQITGAQREGVEKRGEYYDRAGALRDVVQNHLLQLLSLVTCEVPERFDAQSILAKKDSIIRHIKKLTPQEVETSTVRGQYELYTKEEKIAPDSQTETYAMIRLEIDTVRWQGVPIYLRTGKKLMGQVSSIIFQFKEKGHALFEDFWEQPMPNHITIQMQPTEGIGIRLVAKKPGLATTLEPVNMEFCYRKSFDVPQPEAYERLLIDVIIGDQSLFLSQDIIEESWKVIDPIRQVWNSGKPKLATYQPGSWGPKEADELIEKDGRKFLAPLLTICKI